MVRTFPICLGRNQTRTNTSLRYIFLPRVPFASCLFPSLCLCLFQLCSVRLLLSLPPSLPPLFHVFFLSFYPFLPFYLPHFPHPPHGSILTEKTHPLSSWHRTEGGDCVKGSEEQSLLLSCQSLWSHAARVMGPWLLDDAFAGRRSDRWGWVGEKRD